MEKALDISGIDFPVNLPKIPFYLDKDVFEFSLSLFEKCNLKCAFCFESHRNQKIDLDYIR